MIWLDGSACGSLPLPDRGLDFGDGLFETLLLSRGRALFTEFHLARLERGLTRLSFPACLDAIRAQLSSVLDDWAGQASEWAALRLTVTRGAGPRGYAPPVSATPRTLCTITPLERDCAVAAEPARLGVATIRWPQQPALAGLKHLNRLEQVLAAAEARAQGMDEVIVCDQAGSPVSVAAGNLFLVEGDQLITPPLVQCGVSGTRRELLRERWAPACGLRVAERPLRMADCEGADEVFYCNSLVGLRRVASLGQRHWSRFPVCNALFDCYRGELA